MADAAGDVVTVTARICSARAWSDSSRHATRCVRVLVLPAPGPAIRNSRAGAVGYGLRLLAREAGE